MGSEAFNAKTPFQRAFELVQDDNGFSLYDVAERLNYSQGFIGQIVQGGVRAPTDFIEELCDAFGLSALDRVFLDQAADASAREIVVQPVDELQAEVASVFARRLPELDIAALSQLRDMLVEPPRLVRRREDWVENDAA